RALADLGVVELEERVAADRELHHLKAMLRGGPGLGAVPRPACGHPAHAREAEDLRRLLGEPQVPEMHRVEGAAHDADGGAARALGELARRHQVRIWPVPSTTNFCEVRPSRPTGPRACSLSVEMPISAPSPYSKPSAKRVAAFTSTELESASRRKRLACASFSVTIASVCCDPYLAMWPIAASRSLTTRTARMGARYSAYQSCSVAGFIDDTSLRAS